MRDRTHKCIQRVVLVVSVAVGVLLSGRENLILTSSERTRSGHFVCLPNTGERSAPPKQKKATCIFVFALNYTAYVPNINYTNQFY